MKTRASLRQSPALPAPSRAPDQETEDAGDDDGPDRHQVHLIAPDGALPRLVVTLERRHRTAARSRQVVRRALSHRVLRTLAAHQTPPISSLGGIPPQSLSSRAQSSWGGPFSNCDGQRRCGAAMQIIMIRTRQPIVIDHSETAGSRAFSGIVLELPSSR